MERNAFFHVYSVYGCLVLFVHCIREIRLNGGLDSSDKDTDDRNNDKEFNESKESFFLKKTSVLRKMRRIDKNGAAERIGDAAIERERRIETRLRESTRRPKPRGAARVLRCSEERSN